jgi:predicted transcriptional regulator
MPAAKKRTSVTSFRLDEDIAEALRKEAEDEEITLNVLANQIFRHYVEWERDAQRAGFIPIARELLVSIINEISDRRIEEIVRSVGKEVSKDQILYMKSNYDLDSFLSWLGARNRTSGFAQKHVVDGKNHEYIIQHDLNMKWSLYVKTLIEVILDDVYKKKVDFELTPGTVVFRIER